jgi:1-aminocyclopropane-1-carboxylate deaminase/D-cysteine desulfhydrase-like pyridoxal-dependent ACC family enzyme
LITEYHPELNMHNVEEIDAMVKIVRDENGIIVDPLYTKLYLRHQIREGEGYRERAR